MPSDKPRLWTPDFIVLLLISLLAFIGCQALNNGTPIYVKDYEGSTGFSGVLILEFSLCAGLARIVVGRVIDRGMRRRPLIVGAAFMLAGTAGALVLPGIAPQAALRALQGIGFGCVTTASSTAAADVLPARRLGEGIGYFGLGQSLGMAIGPTLGVVLTSMLYRESLFLGVSAVLAVLMVLVFAVRYESHPQKLPETSAYRVRYERGLREQPASAPKGQRGLLSSLFVRTAWAGALPHLVNTFAVGIATSYVALYGTQLGYGNPGIFFILGAITMTLVRLFGGRFIDAIKPIRLFAVPCACGVVFYLMLAFGASEWSFYAAGLFFGLSMGISFPLLNSVCVKCTASERWGAASAQFLLMNDLGVGVGALIWGVAIDAAGFVPVMVGGAVTAALTFVAALVMFPRNLEADGLRE